MMRKAAAWLVVLAVTLSAAACGKAGTTGTAAPETAQSERKEAEPQSESVPEVAEKESGEEDMPDIKEAVPDETPAEQETAEPVAEDGIRPEFKEAMDSYEAFFDEYLAFMEKYEDAEDTLGMLTDYAAYMAKYAEMTAALEALDEEELSTEEALYYTKVTARISQKLIAAA